MGGVSEKTQRVSASWISPGTKVMRRIRGPHELTRCSWKKQERRRPLLTRLILKICGSGRWFSKIGLLWREMEESGFFSDSVELQEALDKITVIALERKRFALLKLVEVQTTPRLARASYVSCDEFKTPWV